MSGQARIAHAQSEDWLTVAIREARAGDILSMALCGSLSALIVMTAWLALRLLGLRFQNGL
jgi:hypothetical protein